MSLLLALGLCLTSVAPGATVVWVSDNKTPAGGVAADQGWVNLLTAKGYTVNLNFRNAEARVLDAGEVTTLNAADIIIISRDTNSGDYASNATEVSQWSAIKAPILLLVAHIARNNRWLWLNSSATTDPGIVTMEAVDAGHPVFYGVTLDGNKRVGILASNSSFCTITNAGNGTLIAKRADNGELWIAEWSSGQPFYAGSTQTPASKRMAFWAGGTTGGVSDGTYNLNAEGEKMFLNTVAYMLGVLKRTKASSPAPFNGAVITDTFATLSWSAGATAASHDVYLGENQQNVAAGTGGTFRGNQTAAWLFIGLVGFPYPAGLQAGKTYYWRIDEVEADGVTKYTGDVWSFSLPLKTASNPNPPDRIKFVDPNADLSWTPGFGAKLHVVYFGTDQATVANATGGATQPLVTYDPGTLQFEKTYYWRIDEFDGVNTYTGPVWSFTVARQGGGARADYYSGTNFAAHLLKRIDPQINFNWAATSPDAAVPVDTFSVRWAADLEAGFTEPYTFYTRTDDGVRLWIDGQLIVDSWVNQSATERSGTIALVAGVHSLQMEYYENTGSAVAELRWESPSTPKQLIPQGALSLPLKASGASPTNGATGVTQIPTLTWLPGEKTASHNVFFGTDAVVVANATTGSPEFKGNKPRGAESFAPGTLAWRTPYYWRIDEVNSVSPDGPWKGNIWSFTTADYLIIDNMEDYNNFPPDRIFETWIDGYGNSSVNGSIVGHPEPDFAAGEGFAETVIRHGGLQSMPHYYNCNFKYSEAVMTLKAPNRDWTQQGIKSLTLWFRGYLATQGSLTEAPAGTFTMTGAGSDIWIINSVEADEFHYAWKMLNGPGTITAKVSAITGTNLNGWAKAGLMIRESLDPNSAHAHMLVSSTNGIALQYRPTAAGTSATSQQKAAISQRPLWLRLDRAFDGTFTASHANDVAGAPDKWTAMTATTIQMTANVYIGLALTSHQAYVPAQVTFSNITLAGTITGAQWTNQDIGIRSNGAERMFVAIQGTTGPQAVAYQTDPQAATRNTWTEWNIPLTAFTGVNLSNVDRISIGFGTKGNTSPGGSGLMYFDDIRLYGPRCMPTLLKPVADLNNNCVVDMADLKLLANDWLKTGASLASDLDQSQKVDFKDYNALAETWLEEKLWP
jgi:hypothetical protein